jgi:hypothetical protein
MSVSGILMISNKERKVNSRGIVYAHMKVHMAIAVHQERYNYNDLAGKSWKALFEPPQNPPI